MARRLLVPLLAWLSIGPALAQTAGEMRQPPSITVDGRASASVVPDTAIISLGVVTERPRAADAAADNSKATQAVFDAIKADGVEPKDFRTTSVVLAPVYDQPPQGSRVTGFRATNIVEIRLQPAERAGQLAAKLIDKGANSIEGIEFVLSPDDALEDKLRADAMRDARHKAQVFVEAIGVKLGRVITIMPNSTERGFRVRAALQAANAGFAKAAPPVPIAAGAQDLQAEVSVTFELEQ